MTEQIRNKYNTLTPAEAKKLNRVLSNSRQPLRTASVLRKPRAPPIVVTNLDNEVERQLKQDDMTQMMIASNNGCNSLSRQASIRSGSMCGGDTRRHTVNYGHHQQQPQGALASRLSLFSTASNKSSGPTYQTLTQQNQQQHQPAQYQLPSQISPHESFSNLSFRSSRDAPDSASLSAAAAAASDGGAAAAAYDPTCRFQTMSVDLSHPTCNRASNRAYDTMRGRVKYAGVPQRSLTLNYRFSDDSFASAKSDLSSSALSSSVTPTKFKPPKSTVREPSRSASKASLSASTYKVFQTPFANFKKLFRGIQKPFGAAAASHQSDLAAAQSGAQISQPLPQHHQRPRQHQCGRSLNDFSLSDSISHLDLNKSQTPPVCPPPPGELKSMSYLENSINYSNYDEFTRSRNERLARPSSGPPPPPASVTPTFGQPPGVAPHQSQQQQQQINNYIQNQHANHVQEQPSIEQQHNQTYDTVAGDETSDPNWQMTSLPVYYERNLTTVFEEKQAQYGGSTAVAPPGPPPPAPIYHDPTTEEIYQRIKPPMRFDDQNNQQQQQQRVTSNSELGGEGCERASSVASSHSPALSCTAESVLEFHRQQPATPYRFSFAQAVPPSCGDQTSLTKSLGLPPRAPTAPAGNQQLSSIKGTSESCQRQLAADSSSTSGNSSNCSSQMNGIDHCDTTKRNHHHPTNSSIVSSGGGGGSSSSSSSSGASAASEAHTHAAAVSDAIDKLSLSINESTSGCSGGGGYGNVSGLNSGDDPDATLLSETSTLVQGGGGGGAFYVNKCAELERTVASLKSKLIGKEKELTDLQLTQLNNDYTIERLRKQVGKLERENAQLKAMVVTRSGGGGNENGATNAISRIHV